MGRCGRWWNATCHPCIVTPPNAAAWCPPWHPKCPASAARCVTPSRKGCVNSWRRRRNTCRARRPNSEQRRRRCCWPDWPAPCCWPARWTIPPGAMLCWRWDAGFSAILRRSSALLAIAHICRRADEAAIVAKLGGNDARHLRRALKGPRLHRLEDRLKKERSGIDQTAADDDGFGIQRMDQVGAAEADGRAGMLEQRVRFGIALFGGLRHIASADAGCCLNSGRGGLIALRWMLRQIGLMRFEDGLA